MSKNRSVESRVIETKPILWNQLQFLQADTFKEISPQEREKLRNSILERGFVDPFFVWLDSETGVIYCLDGKHRTDELEALIIDGYQVPEELPATFVRCNDKKEAAELVLVYSSYYAKITCHGFYDFLEQYKLDISSIGSGLNFPDLNIDEITALPDYTVNNKELNIDGFEDTMEMKFSLSKDDFIKVNQRLKDLADTYQLENKEAVLLKVLDLND